MKLSNRTEDSRRSDIVMRLLQRIFYREYTHYYKCVYDRDTQIQGVDSEFFFGNNYYRCDEKAATNYINRNLGSFALEICFNDKTGRFQEGWYIRENRNDSYLFVWIDKGDVRLQSEKDIEEGFISLVRKRRIDEYLKSCGLDKTDLWNISVQMINSGTDKMIYKGFRFVKSSQLAENPVNIIMPRHILYGLSDMTARIDSEKCVITHV